MFPLVIWGKTAELHTLSKIATLAFRYCSGWSRRGFGLPENRAIESIQDILALFAQSREITVAKH
jgi:hypothetical protein